MRLDLFRNPSFCRGASKLKELCWICIGGLLVSSYVPGSFWRVALLRLFGASIGRGVVIKPRVLIKFPWRLDVGDHVWIGERVWIDNLAAVSLGGHTCVSQGVYFCTGSHDWTLETFDLVVKPIRVEPHAWLCAMSKVSPGVTVYEGAVLGFGSIATSDLLSWTVYFGCPATPKKPREMVFL